MKALTKMTWVELKLKLREPVGTFFTLVFPLLLLFLFGSIYGNEPTPFLNGRGNVDNSVPGYIAMIIGTTGM
ncbi:MAG: ABC transporter permease, partial [Ardenticatenaceae bacterium]|nr:ABC transporter permease [Ardenticatenaceae bacterium]